MAQLPAQTIPPGFPPGMTVRELCAQDWPPPPQLVPGIVPMGHTLFVAVPKFGKSAWAQQLALCIATGTLFLGEPLKPGQVLWLDYEHSDGESAERMQTLCEVLGLSEMPEAITRFHDWPRIHEGGGALIEEWLRQNPQCRLVIVDTLGRIRSWGKEGSYQQDYEAGWTLKRIAEAFTIAILSIWHTNKAKSQDLNDPLYAVSGTTGLIGAVDTVLLGTRSRLAGGRSTLLITGRSVAERELVLAGTPETGWWIDAAEQQAVARAREEVLEVLRTCQPATLQELVRESERWGKKVQLNTLRKRVQRMLAAGELVVVEGNQRNGYRYGVPWPLSPALTARMAYPLLPPLGAPRNAGNGSAVPAPCAGTGESQSRPLPPP